MTFRSIIRLLFAMLMALQLNCASRGMPGGGPVDRTPPEVLETYPMADSTGIENLDEIVIGFSERMDESATENAIFISPPLKYETEWSGGEDLTLYLLDTLRNDVTYVVTIGSGASDARKNRMNSSYQFAFSTGMKIQTGSISGMVYGISEKDPFYVYAYFAEDTLNPDIDPSMMPADFISQPGASGEFSLNYLKLGRYRVFIVEDQNRNFLLDADYERVGIPARDVRLDSLQETFDNLYYIVTKIDTIAPQATGARAVNNGKVLLRLSEPVRPIVPLSVTISDTLQQKMLAIRTVIPNNKEKNQYFIFTETQTAGAGYLVMIDQLCDTTGNCQDSIQYAAFTGSGEADTTTFRILKISPRDSAKNVSLDRPVSFQLSKPVDPTSFGKAFTIYTGHEDTLSVTWEWDNLENGYMQSDSRLTPGETYNFTLREGRVRSVWGDTLPDTTITRIFSMRPEDEFGSLSGITAMGSNFVENTFLFLRPIGGRAQSRYFRPAPDSTFQVAWLPEGKYILGGFIDLDQDNKYSPGNLYPFKYSEPYYVQPDTIHIRKRWEVSDFTYSIPALDTK